MATTNDRTGSPNPSSIYTCGVVFLLIMVKENNKNRFGNPCSEDPCLIGQFGLCLLLLGRGKQGQRPVHKNLKTTTPEGWNMKGM